MPLRASNGEQGKIRRSVTATSRECCNAVCTIDPPPTGCCQFTKAKSLLGWGGEMSIKNLLTALCCAAMAPALAHANCLQFTPPNPQPTLSASWTGALGAMNAAAQGEGENLNTPNFANALGANTELAGFRPVLVMVDESSSFGETDYEAALRSLQQRVGTFRVVEKDDPVPARLFELINNAPRPGGLCSLAPTL